ncbi:MAG: AAA family ATPase [Bacteroidetes bacterium HGW-Bacteroidetes-11]|jgi:ATP-dependent DNA helicase RecG|nr:MAG: AAA family ATPase [Bacteroidetes bacterium HGW-Bacteroidetes-11]
MIPAKETDQIEFKTAFNEAAIETLVAFSNTRGGTVYIGVSDDAEIKGITTGKESLTNWANEVKGKTDPHIIPDFKTITIEEKTVVLMSVIEYPVKPVCTKGRYFKRVGSSNHLLSISEVVDLHLQSLNSSWDAFPDPIHSLEDISMEKIQASIKAIALNSITINENPLAFISKYNLLRDNKLTNAAYLLFKRNETSDTTIELGRFQTEIIIKDSRRSKSDVIAQIDQVLEFVKKHINKEVIITDKPHNIQKWQYPIEAIREIIINMVVHRDYRLSSDSIVKIFDNKIEFYNPGRLPASISIEDLISNNYRSTPRNKLLADFFKDLGLIEKYGSGIQRIINY